MKVVNGLEDHLHFGAQPLGGEQTGDGVDKVGQGNEVVEGAQDVVLALGREGELVLGALVGLGEGGLAANLLEAEDEGVEGHELIQGGHIDAVAIGIEDGRGRGGHDNLLGAQAIEDWQDGPAHRVPADNGVVEHDERIRAGADQAVGDIVDVHCQLLAGLHVGDKGAELRVLHRHLAEADGVAIVQCHRQERLQQAVEADLRGVGDVADEGVLQVAIQRADELGHEGVAQVLALGVDLGIVGTRKVDALEDARAPRLGVQAIDQLHLAIGVDDHRLAGG